MNDKVRRRLWTILGALLIAGAITWIATRGRAPVPVTIIHPQRGRMEELVTGTTVGSLEADRSAEIGSEISARVLRIHAREGTVEANAPLITLEGSELRAQQEKLRREIEVAQNQRSRAVLSLERVKDALHRQESLDPSIRIEEEYAQLRKDHEIAAKDIEIADGRLQALQAELTLLDVRLSKTEIRAPFAGTITRLRIEEGETAVPGQILLSMISAGPPLVRVAIDEVDVGRLFLKCPARVRFDAYPGEVFEGAVFEILPAATTDTKYNRTVDVKVRVSKLPVGIVVGMSAHVELITRTQEDTLYLSNQVVREDHRQGEEFVFVLESGLAHRRKIRSGLSNWEYREVLEGVTVSDAIIVPRIVEDEAVIEDGTRVVVHE